MQSLVDVGSPYGFLGNLYISGTELRYNKHKSKTNTHPDRHNRNRVVLVLIERVMTKKTRPFPYTLEDTGRIIEGYIERGCTLSGACAKLGEVVQRSANAIRRYWNAYAMFHKIEYNNKTNKIEQL